MKINRPDTTVYKVTQAKPVFGLKVSRLNKEARESAYKNWLYSKDGVIVDGTGEPVFDVGMNTLTLLTMYTSNEILGFGTYYTTTDIKAEIDLMEEYGVRRIRGHVMPYSPGDYRRYFGEPTDSLAPTKRQLFFDKLEEILDYCVLKGVSVVADLNPWYRTIPDYVGGHMSDWGNPDSFTWRVYKTYMLEFLDRFSTHPAICMWSHTNEMDNPVLQRTTPIVYNDPYLGTGQYYEKPIDQLSYSGFLVYLQTFYDILKSNDKTKRLIGSGVNGRISSPLSGNLWNWMHHFYTASQYVDVLSIHNYQNFSGTREMDYTYKEFIAALRKMAKAQNKPFLVEEFGTSDVAPESSVISTDWPQFSGTAREAKEIQIYKDTGVQFIKRWQWAPVGASNILGLHPTYESGIQEKVDLWNQLVALRDDYRLNTSIIDPDTIPVESFTSKENAPCIKLSSTGRTRFETSIADLFPNPNYWAISFWIRLDSESTNIAQLIPFSNMEVGQTEYAGNKGFHTRLSRTGRYFQMVYRWEEGSPTEYRAAPIGSGQKAGVWYHYVINCGIDQAPTDTYITGMLSNAENGEYANFSNFRDFGQFGAGPVAPLGWAPNFNAPLCLGSPLDPAFSSEGIQNSSNTNFSIGDFIIYNRPLMDSEVRDLYRKDQIPYELIVARWRFDNTLQDDVNGKEFVLTSGTFEYENTLTVPTNIYAELSDSIVSKILERSTFNPETYS